MDSKTVGEKIVLHDYVQHRRVSSQGAIQIRITKKRPRREGELKKTKRKSRTSPWKVRLDRLEAKSITEYPVSVITEYRSLAEESMVQWRSSNTRENGEVSFPSVP